MTGAGPVVGIVGHGYVVPRPFGMLPVTGTPDAYVARVAAAGGRPVVLPAMSAVDLIGTVDALVLTGGGDVDPATYGGRGPAVDVDPARDAAEIAIVRAAASARVPLLAVCRGLQVLAVAFGGTLTADLGTRHVRPGAGHRVRAEPGSLVERLLGASPLTTALHHQAVADPGPRWRVTARADDGVVEALEPADEHGPDAWPVLGVQWHPELPDDAGGPALFAWLHAVAGVPAGR